MRALLEIALSNAVLATFAAGVIALAVRFVRRPAIVHALWLLVLARLLMPPLVGVPVPGWVEPPPPTDKPVAVDTPALTLIATEVSARALLPGPLETEPAPITAEAEAPPPRSSIGWASFLVIVWLAGAAVWFVWTGCLIVRFRRLLTHARPAPPTVQQRADELAGRLGLRRRPGVWLVPGALSPMAWAAGGSPRVLFPVRLLEQLDADQLDGLLAHELAHLRRRDHWVRYLELAVSGLYWWLPIVGWVRRGLHEAEEQCCDAWAVWAVGEGRPYALALLQTVAFVSGAKTDLPAVASGVGHAPQLRRRLTMIMQGEGRRSLTRAGVWAVLGCSLPLLAIMPVRAQTPPDAPKEQPKPPVKVEGGNLVFTTSSDDMEVVAFFEEGTADSLKPEEVQKLKDEIAALSKQLEDKRKELKDLEAKHSAVVARLYKPTTAQVRFVTTTDTIRTPVTFTTTRAVRTPTTVRVTGEIAKTQPKPATDKATEKATEVAKKLDQLLKELEELRREMKKP